MCHQASHGAPELRCAHWIEAETGSSGSVRGAAGGWRATCTGEQADSRSAPARHQTETGSSGAQERTGCLAAGEVRSTKDRDTPALEVRAGMPGVGRTARDAAGVSSTNRNRVKVARTPVENRPQSLRSVTEAEFRPLLLWLSEEAQQTARESCQRTKAWKYRLTGRPAHPPWQGTRRLYPNRVF